MASLFSGICRSRDFLTFWLRSHIENYRLGRPYREVMAVRLGSRSVFLPDLEFVPTEKSADQVPGFLLHRAWLDPANLPEVASCLEVIAAAQ